MSAAGSVRIPEFEYRVLSVPRGVSRAEMRRRLADDAEYGHWELAMTRTYRGGSRKVWLRRRILRVRGTL